MSKCQFCGLIAVVDGRCTACGVDDLSGLPDQKEREAFVFGLCVCLVVLICSAAQLGWIKKLTEWIA